jgi:hypothetical protein
MTWYPWSLVSWVATASPMPELAPEMSATVSFAGIVFVFSRRNDSKDSKAQEWVVMKIGRLLDQSEIFSH